jgi:hypothetical protein
MVAPPFAFSVAATVIVSTGWGCVRTGARASAGGDQVVFTRRSAAVAVGLPTGWPAAVDRFARAVHRYSDRVEVISDRTLRTQLQDVGAVLDAALDDVRRTTRRRRTRAEDPGMVRAVLRAGTLCAHATEAAVAAADASRRREPDRIERQVRVAHELAGSIRELAYGCYHHDR